MHLKIDENLPTAVAELVKKAGHNASTVYDERLAGVSDSALLTVCQEERWVFLTLDLDFADIRVYPPAEHNGLVVMKLARQDKEHVLAAVERWLAHVVNRDLSGQLWIVDETSIRVRI